MKKKKMTQRKEGMARKINIPGYDFKLRLSEYRILKLIEEEFEQTWRVSTKEKKKADEFDHVIRLEEKEPEKHPSFTDLYKSMKEKYSYSQSTVAEALKRLKKLDLVAKKGKLYTLTSKGWKVGCNSIPDEQRRRILWNIKGLREKGYTYKQIAEDFKNNPQRPNWDERKLIDFFNNNS